MRIGVTGIFASGKGTVCSMFEQLGAVVIDTDIVAREVVEPGSEGLRMIVQAFPDAPRNPDGSLDRRAFGRLVFASPELVSMLNEITHPLILTRVKEMSSGNGIYMVNTPLLFESGFDRIMDVNIVVTAGDDQVIERGQVRDGISEDEIRGRLAHQISLNEKKKRADYIIDNSGTLENTRRQVVDLWKILKPLTTR